MNDHIPKENCLEEPVMSPEWVGRSRVEASDLKPEIS